MLINIFETKIKFILIIYLIFTLKAWYDLKNQNQLNLIYLGNVINTLELIKKCLILKIIMF